MNGWMKRRIERSRARCDRAAATPKAYKEQSAESRPKLTAVASPGNDSKGS